jgi:DOPA 4,5-dioxygenase
MADIQNFHAHIYFDAHEIEAARSLAGEAAARFAVSVGRFHETPVGPHPRGSCQLTVAPERFGDFALWASVSRRGLTIFAHPSSGDERVDHVDHVVWFGPSEALDLSVLD